MKKKDLEKELKSYGWHFKRHGGNHDIWTNGEDIMPVPRKTIIKKFLAKKISKKAKESFKDTFKEKRL